MNKSMLLAASGKNSADRSLLIDLMFWVSQNPPPAHLFLISSDKDFAEVLHRLRMSNYNILIAGMKTSSLLCNVGTIVWHWNSLLRGKNLDGKHFNHPPDGLYGGHNDAPLEDAFPELRPIPKAVVRQVHQILRLYPNGVSLLCLKTELERTGISLDKDYYGYKRFSYFISSIVRVHLQLVPGRGLIVHRIPEESPEPTKSSFVPSTKLVENEEWNHVPTSTELDATSEKSNNDDKYAMPTKKEPDAACHIGGSMETHNNSFSKHLTFLGWIKSWWPLRKKFVNMHTSTARVNEMVSNATEPELLGWKQTVSHDDSHDKETEMSNLKQRVSHSEGLHSLKQRQMASQFKEPELSELRQTVDHSGEQDLFHCSSFWKEMESFVFTSRGAIIVFHSRSRKDMALSFKKYGPHVLHSLSESDLLLLVDLLISEKKWLEERPSQTFPFRAIPSRTTQSKLQKSSECQFDKNQSIPHDVVSSPATQKGHAEKSTTDMLADVQKLVSEILRDQSNGCNMGLIPDRFLEKYGYHLDFGKLGYSKLSHLIRSLPGVETEDAYFFPANHGIRASGKETSILKTQETKPSDVVYHYSGNEFCDSNSEDDQQDSTWEELGPATVRDSNKSDLVSKPRQKAIELKSAIDLDYEPDLSDDDSFVSGGDNSCLTQSEYDHFSAANNGICASGEETSILKTQETKLGDVVHHYPENELYDSFSEDDRKDSPWEELGPVCVINSNDSDLESKPRQKAIELKTAIDPDYEHDLSDDDSSESGGDNSCLTQSTGEGAPKLNGKDGSLQNLDLMYGSQEGGDSVNPNEANTVGNGLTDGLNPSRISTPAASSGIHSGGNKEGDEPKKNGSFDAEPVSHKDKELMQEILRCLKRANDLKMPN
ncbi:uncharacterized protein LOC114753159 isoform X2 [Neltuma alba]|uniref:uncharacterized protein LOC114753159 isoform X2 n=1 Tax=Neltuma alba TaxID=207710 RepID=UPI0010A4D16F|nr:uncharacterized protein LOC114753159 isoform X2 [Prosopis alba]